MGIQRDMFFDMFASPIVKKTHDESQKKMCEIVFCYRDIYIMEYTVLKKNTQNSLNQKKQKSWFNMVKSC